MRLFLLIISYFLSTAIFAQAPAIQWAKCYGGTLGEHGQSIKSTSDGGYVIAGYCQSADGDVMGNHGGNDFWIIKINNLGKLQWQKSLGGSLSDTGGDIFVTSDGGYIVVGSTESNNGDVTGHHGPTYSKDLWVVKLNSSGSIEWQKCYGGTLEDVGESIQQTKDGGYIISGYTNSNDGDVVDYHNKNFGTYDAWVLKISLTGDIQWQKCLGGSMNDIAYKIKQTNEGGYILIGAAQSSDGDIDPANHHGINNDYWVVKLSSSGSIEWQKSYGGSNDDWGQDIEITADGGYIIAGRSVSYNGDVTPNPLTNNGAFDFWIVKISSSGILQWQKSFGGTNIEDCWSIKQTCDDGYIVAGSSFSYDGNVGVYLPVQSNNVWLIKLSRAGDLEWQRSAGSTDWEGASSLILTNDGGFILTGYASKNDGDVSGFHGGYGDLWVVKFGVFPLTGTSKLDLGPDTTLCPGNTITLNAKKGFASYQWQDGSTDSTFIVTQPGTYFVKTTNACGGVFYDTVIVSAHPPIPFDVGPDLSKCNNDSLTIIAPSGFISYEWTPAYNINSTSSQTVKVYPAIDTIYKVKAEKTPGCFAYDSVRIKVYTSPKIDLGIDKNFCFGDSVVLNAGAGFNQYLWSTGNVYQQIVVKNAGTYSVTATTTNSCTSKDTIRILSVYPNPIVKLDHDSTLCMGSARILNAGNFASYLWNTGNTSQLLSINTTGIYSVTVADNNNCKGRDSVEIVTILPSPSNFLPADTAVCSYGSLVLAAKTAFPKYLWSTNAVTSSINITQPGIYWLQVKDFNNCTGKDSIVVAQKDCLKGFFIPNAFSPNNDGKNDIYRPMLFGKVMLYEFTIYNQWGESVFKSVDLNKGWDGKYKSLQQDNQIFVWTCKYQFENELVKTEKGTVLLLR